MSDSVSGNIPIQLLSDAVSNPIIKAHKEGGLALVFVLVGTLLLLSAFFFGLGIFGYAALSVGILIILTVVAFFYLQTVRPLQRLEKQIRKNQEIIDTFQIYAIQMADLANNLHKLTIYHMDDVVKFVGQYHQVADVLVPMLQRFNVPGAKKIVTIVDDKYVARAENLSTSILLATHQAGKIIENVQMALLKSDLEPLKQYLGQVKELDQKLQELLKKTDNG